MSDRERSRSGSAFEERKVKKVNGEQSPSIQDSPKIKEKKSFSRSPSQGRTRKMSYRSDRGERPRYRSRSRSRSDKRYKSRYSHSRSRSRSRGRYGRRDRSHSHSPMSSRRRHIGTRDNPAPSRCLGVFGLSVYTTEQELYHIFSKYGPVERVQIIIDAKTGRSRGFAFVYFESTEDAKVAKEQCTGMKINAKCIRVDYSITERAHTPTPGIYMGKPTYSSDRGGGGWGDGRWRGGRERDDYYNRGGYRDRRSPSPYYRRRRYERSRSRSYSPRIDARGRG